MIKYLLCVITLVATISLTGCQQSAQNSSTDPDIAEVSEGEIIATVNGKPITEETLTMISQANRGANIPREKLLDDLIKHELLYQEAIRKNLENKPEVAQRLSFVKRSILSQSAMQDFIQNSPVTDAEIQKSYDETFGGANGSEEFKARHILTKTEDKAKEVIQKLSDGGDFAELAKEYSTGPSGPKGGDLGWFGPDQMVGPFSAAVVALPNGEFTKEPVKTQFGWHVILREDSRAKTPPPLASVKANIQAQLQRKAIENHLESLKSAAKIEIMPEKTEAPAQPATLPSPPAEKAPAAKVEEKATNTEEKPKETAAPAEAPEATETKEAPAEKAAPAAAESPAPSGQ